MQSKRFDGYATTHRLGQAWASLACFASVPLFAILLAAQSTVEPKLIVAGDVPTPLTLSASDLAAMPRERVELTDRREEPGGDKATYEGVALQEILKKAGIAFGKQMRGKAMTGYVLAEAKDGYQVLFSLGELDSNLGDAHIIVADKRDGKALFPYEGPIRLVLPGDKEPARSIRMLEKLELVRLRK